MKKIIVFCLLLAFIVNCCPKSYAVNWDRVVQKMEGYNAVLYFCDWERGTVILKDVSAVGKVSEEALTARKDYLEVPLYSGVIYTKPGERSDKEAINTEHLDKKVYVILAKNFNVTYCAFIKIIE